MNMPPLNALRGFDAAARHMSFQKAAAELFVTPAALSYQIRHLEDHLGVKLFRRLNRAVELTEMGKLMVPGIREAFEQIERSVRKVKRRQSENILVISAGPSFTAKWLAPRLYRFIALHPEIDARISASLALTDLTIDDVDVAIRFGRGVYADCDAIKLFDEYVTPMCSPHLFADANQKMKVQDLTKYTLIHDDTHMGLFELPDWTDWLKQAGGSDVDPSKRSVHFNISDHALDAAVSGAGVVLGRTRLAQSDLEAGRLFQPFDLKMKATFSFYAVTLQTRSQDPVIKAFVDWIIDEAAGTADQKVPGPAV